MALCGVTSETAVQKIFYSERNFLSKQLIMKYNVELYYISTSNNDADCGTKILKKNVALCPEYWNSIFFGLDEEKWPVKKFEFNSEYSSILLNPKLIIQTRKVAVQMQMPELENVFTRFNSFEKILKSVAYVFCWAKRLDFGVAIQEAKTFLIQTQNISKDEISGVQRQYMVEKTAEGVHMVIPRSQDPVQFCMN